MSTDDRDPLEERRNFTIASYKFLKEIHYEFDFRKTYEDFMLQCLNHYQRLSVKKSEQYEQAIGSFP